VERSINATHFGTFPVSGKFDCYDLVAVDNGGSLIPLFCKRTRWYKLVHLPDIANDIKGGPNNLIDPYLRGVRLGQLREKRPMIAFFPQFMFIILSVSWRTADYRKIWQQPTISSVLHGPL
jgi:hypothetical protein